ncbi:hypothetical protein DASC09_022790 [Saccharomycopsis crataegensis]|uniref:Uncharacterized protein n=1 Tax=Saccharomycopsis crataegensis TaxID=43959 RepID=A0AAV5QK14_9ASCO|nr:hypothetical protein DASC09_022790 [Saccharomycopsis crataegensis]
MSRPTTPVSQIKYNFGHQSSSSLDFSGDGSDKIICDTIALSTGKVHRLSDEKLKELRKYGKKLNLEAYKQEGPTTQKKMKREIVWQDNNIKAMINDTHKKTALEKAKTFKKIESTDFKKSSVSSSSESTLVEGVSFETSLGDQEGGNMKHPSHCSTPDSNILGSRKRKRLFEETVNTEDKDIELSWSTKRKKVFGDSKVFLATSILSCAYGVCSKALELYGKR